MTEPAPAPVVFKGKIAPWWYATVVLMLAVTIRLGAQAYFAMSVGLTKDAVILLCITVFSLVADIFMIDSCIRNRITLFDDHLKVRLSVFSETIPYRDINLIRETNNPLASLSTSLDRLLIRWQSYNDILVSVKDKEGFLAELSTRNPSIHIERKHKKTEQ